MHSVEKTFCGNVAFLRQSTGLTKKEMAEILGVGVGVIRKIEQGKTLRIHCGMLCRVCDRFEISADRILYTKLDEE